jgi:hypothetical protein
MSVGCERKNEKKKKKKTWDIPKVLHFLSPKKKLFKNFIISKII